jgi:hypothetical protein
MKTVQTNVRVPPDDKPVIRAIAARLRTDVRFGERLRELLSEDQSPALEERIARLEEQMRRLLAPGGSAFVDPHESGPSNARYDVSADSD